MKHFTHAPALALAFLLLLSTFAPAQLTRAQTAAYPVQIAAANDHACALLSNGQIYCWGRNDYGQLGDGSYLTRPTARAVIGIPDSVQLAQVSTNGLTSCARTTLGAVYCWGDNRDSQVGASSSITSFNTARLQSSLTVAAKDLSVGDRHACVVTTSGAVYCWGSNDAGQFGSPVFGASTPVPLQSDTLSRNRNSARRVAAGTNVTCVSQETGDVLCAGTNYTFELGNGTVTDPNPIATQVQMYDGSGFGPLTNVTALVSSDRHMCISRRQSSGSAIERIFCWGPNTLGQGGTLPAVQQNLAVATAVTIPPALVSSTFVNPAVGQAHSCGTLALRLVCWGSNTHGQIGQLPTTTDYVSTATEILQVQPGGLQDAQFALGDNFSCVLVRTIQAGAVGTVYCWGQNDYAQVGLPANTQVLQANPIAFPGAVQQPTPTPPPPTSVPATPTSVVTSTATVAAPTATPRPLRNRFLPLTSAETGREREPNDNSANATPLRLFQTMDGAFDDAYDVYATTLTTGTLSAVLSGVAADYAPNVQLQLYRSAIITSTRVDDALAPPYQVFANVPGRYFIVVYSGSPQATRSYRLIATTR
jgi:alpha-tubulin suppressor-like RCC1 family protein